MSVGDVNQTQSADSPEKQVMCLCTQTVTLLIVHTMNGDI